MCLALSNCGGFQATVTHTPILALRKQRNANFSVAAAILQRVCKLAGVTTVHFPICTFAFIINAIIKRAFNKEALPVERFKFKEVYL